MSTILLRAFALVVLLSAACLRAQVPQLISYQGRMVVGTTNFDGPGQFKFALVDATGANTYWSNDGSSVAGSQPTNAVSLTVTKGFYSVLLGDATLTNMTVVPATVFTNPDVRLRVWFNDGSTGFQLLTPDQRIAAVGYAMMAAGVEMPSTTSATSGVIIQNGTPLIHTFGPNNFFAGVGAGNFTMTGSDNFGIGYQVLDSNTTGHKNTAFGSGTLQANTTGLENHAMGFHALYQNIVGNQNMAVGSYALENNLASINTAAGYSALQTNTTGTNNTALGYLALQASPTASNNTAVGGFALRNLAGSSSNSNTAVGQSAGMNLTSGNGNVLIGSAAGLNLTTGTNNIDIGNGGVAGESSTTRIGTAQTSVFIAGINGATSSGGTAVFINSSGQLGTITSSRRYKENIQDMDKSSEALLALRPVTFQYKPEIDPKGIPQFGLIAEEVEKIDSDLVVRDEKGAVQTVRYEQVNAMLLNEFLKEHQRVKTLERRLAELETRDKEREARLNKLEQSSLPAMKTPVALDKPEGSNKP